MKKIKLSVASALVSILFLIVSGTVLFKLLEEWTWIQSFYFTVSTLTTVGYGDDIVPSSDTTRLFTSLYILAGVGVMLAALTTIGSRYLQAQEKSFSDQIIRKLRPAKLKKPVKNGRVS